MNDKSVEVLFCDEEILVVNKPAGMTVIPAGHEPDAQYLKLVLEVEFGKLWVVHRLDRQTSGVLVFARSSRSHRALNKQFENRQAVKIYHALVCGVPSWERKFVDLPLRAAADRNHRTLADERHGKPSITNFTVLERFRNHTLLEAAPLSGRTHQIRAHLRAVDAPVAVDALYGDGKPLFLSQIKPNYRKKPEPERPLLDRIGLHAKSLKIWNPGNDDLQEFEAPYPKDFRISIKQLRKYS